MNRNILTFLNEYAEIPDPQYAIMLRGAWGCGKTFFYPPMDKATEKR
ncbi:P-loop NTPase fold protein [Bacteroides fragilis]